MKIYRGTAQQFDRYFLQIYGTLALALAAGGSVPVLAYAWRAQWTLLPTVSMILVVLALTWAVVWAMWRRFSRRRESWTQGWIVVDPMGIEQHNGQGRMVRINGTDGVLVRDSALWLTVSDRSGQNLVVVPKFYNRSDVKEIRAAIKRFSSSH